MVEDTTVRHAGENVASPALVRAAFELARSLNISKLVVQSDELGDVRVVDELRESEQVIWLTRQADELPSAVRPDDTILRLPGAGLTRMSQLKLVCLFR